MAPPSYKEDGQVLSSCVSMMKSRNTGIGNQGSAFSSQRHDSCTEYEVEIEKYQNSN